MSLENRLAAQTTHCVMGTVMTHKAFGLLAEDSLVAVCRAELIALEAIAPGETAWPLAWRAQLDPGAYTLTWGAEGYGETTVEFQIVERDGRLYLDS